MRVFCTIAAVVLAGGIAPSVQAQTVGKVDAVLFYAYGQPPGEARRATFENSPVVSNEILETVERGGMRVTFLDDTQLVLGGSSVVTVDRTVFDADRSTGSLTLGFARGAFRFVTGRLQHEKINLRTGAATIGIRGTDWTMTVNDRGDTVVNMRSGSALVTSNTDRSQVTLGRRQSVTVPAGGGVGPAIDFPAFYDGAVGDPAIDATLLGGTGFGRGAVGDLTSDSFSTEHED